MYSHIVSSHGFIIEVQCRNQPNDTKLALYKPFLSLKNSCTYMTKQKEHFSFKDGCGIHSHVYPDHIFCFLFLPPKEKCLTVSVVLRS